ncbi:MAG: ribose 5-phosphate isomerase A [Candidatus Pacebacteria bacterium]|nr:ribose 5-phosphate isomerase A [Candidatus Paceibacterota bacterium]
MTHQESQKKAAAEKGVDHIKSGMILGLGTGSTFVYALNKIARLINKGELKNIAGIPTSKKTEKLAVELGVPLTTLSEQPEIDLTIDGADEVDNNLNLIKGGGGALLREKIIAQASNRNIIIVDDSKLSENLGQKWAVPVEIIPFAFEVEKKFLESIGAVTKLRREKNGEIYITDEGNYIIDANFGIIDNPTNLAVMLESRAGIVEHGLFIDTTALLIVSTVNGIKEIKR